MIVCLAVRHPLQLKGGEMKSASRARPQTSPILGPAVDPDPEPRVRRLPALDGLRIEVLKNSDGTDSFVSGKNKNVQKTRRMNDCGAYSSNIEVKSSRDL